MDSDDSSDIEMEDGPLQNHRRRRSQPSNRRDDSDGTRSSSPIEDSTKVKMAPKKKGTAAKKGAKKSKVPKSKADKTNSRAPIAGRGSADESDNGPYCICRGPDDHRWMIGCDVCEDWFHGSCVDLEEEIGENLIERFVCPNCTGDQNYTKYKKACSLGNCKAPARLYTKEEADRSVFCSNEHCDSWWASMIATLPTKAATKKAIEVLTQEDLMGIIAGAANGGGWALGHQPFGKAKGLWANGLPTQPGVLSDEEQAFLQNSAAERLALGNEIVQYKKMLQLIDWANERRQSLLEAGKFSKDTCGYDSRLDTVSVRPQFAAWLETTEGQATFKAGKLGDSLGSEEGEEGVPTHSTCEKKRCKPHNGWYKQLVSAVRVLIKETAMAAADKLDAEEVMRQEAGIRFERRQLENHWVEVLE